MEKLNGNLILIGLMGQEKQRWEGSLLKCMIARFMIVIWKFAQHQVFLFPLFSRWRERKGSDTVRL